MYSSFVSSHHIVNSVCWSRALVSGSTSKMAASDGGLCSDVSAHITTSVSQCHCCAVILKLLDAGEG